MGVVPDTAFRVQIVALTPVYMNALLMGCSHGWIPNAIYFLMEGVGGDVQATSHQCALIVSFSEFGKLIFAIPAGILVDAYGRKKIIVSAAFLHFFAWLALSLDTSFITISVGRFIIGVAIALVNSSALISIGEIASPEIRGQLTSIYQIFLYVGCFFPAVISVIFSSYKSLTWSITIISIIGMLSMVWASETPSFLVSVSKQEQARNNLRCIRQGYNENQIDTEFEKLQKYIEHEKSNKRKLSWLKFIKTKSIRKPLLIGILLNFFVMLVGAPFIEIYITLIFPTNQFVPKTYYPLFNQLVSLLIALSTAFYIEKFPRRTIFLFGAAATTLINAVCAFAKYFCTENQIEDVFQWVFLLGNILTIICFDASIQPMNNAVKSELFPQAVKGFCGSLVSIGQASSAIVLYQLYNLIRDYFHIYLIYVVFSINSFILCLIIYFMLPEGRGTSLADLQMKFNQIPRPSSTFVVESNGNKL